MESFPGVFIASTNLMEGLDQAVLRRFDVKVKFDFLKPEQSWELLRRYCIKLKFATPQPEQLARVMRLQKLTAGDFAAVVRQNRFRPITSSAALAFAGDTYQGLDAPSLDAEEMAWAQGHGIRHILIEPGRPMQNGYIESFNGRFRDECLNEHWLVTMAQAKRIIENWRIEYNTERPHSSLGNRTPVEFVMQSRRKTEDDLSLTADSNSDPY